MLVVEPVSTTLAALAARPAAVPAADGVPGELQDPVGYAGPWLVLAVAGLALVAAYYLAVLWWGRPRRPERRTPRAETLERLAVIEAAVGAGTISAREGHRQVSETVRGFVADESGVPARTMTLADLQAQGPTRLTEVVALVYPPEFGPGEALPAERFAPVVERARELVSRW